MHLSSEDKSVAPVPLLFDCNVHPTVTGQWLDGREICGFEQIQQDLVAAGVGAAAAVGLPDVGGYDDQAFIVRCQGWNWIPVAAWSGDASASEGVRRVRRLADIGYRAIKIHPRLLGGCPSSSALRDIFRAAHACDLAVMLCTYPCYSAARSSPVDLLTVLQTALREVPEVRLMLMHAGGVELLKFMEFARANPQITLDLSFTLIKYQGSSIDSDLSFLFKKFDQRVVIGSDYPEFAFSSVRDRVIDLACSVSEEQQENIFWRNAATFFGMPL